MSPRVDSLFTLLLRCDIVKSDTERLGGFLGEPLRALENALAKAREKRTMHRLGDVGWLGQALELDMPRAGSFPHEFSHDDVDDLCHNVLRC